MSAIHWLGIVGVFLGSSGVLLVLYLDKAKAYKEVYEQYRDVVDLDAVVKLRNEEIKGLGESLVTLRAGHAKKTEALATGYREKKTIFDRLSKELAVMEDDLESASFGLYQPHYDFDTSESYKKELESLRNNQKAMIKQERAVVYLTEWTVDGSKAKGKKQMKQYSKLMLRAFNGECDSAMAKVRWNNVARLEQRIAKVYQAINRLGAGMHIEITTEYHLSKRHELWLTHEYAEKRHEEQEEQRRIKEEMREEAKAIREMEKAQKDAEEEEQRQQEALAKARAEMQEATGAQVGKLSGKIAELEKRLADAQTQKERAISRAQLTKSGHVYIISNVGSFGKDAYKIGMTRRLDPLDRVRELGGASVPFSFDVHAMVYSDDAPTLEAILQNAFDDRRINMVNRRKEFFRVSLKEIESIVNENFGELEFTKVVEAREFRETLALRQQAKEEAAETVASRQDLPASI